jgi:hypothetical protein
MARKRARHPLPNIQETEMLISISTKQGNDHDQRH